MKRRAFLRSLAILSLLLLAGVVYLAAMPIDERSCALRWSDGLTVEESRLRMRE